MKEIQEKRIENELKFIKESSNDISKIITKLNSENEFQIDILIPSSLTNHSTHINLVLSIQRNYPYNPPKLYFTSKFSFPHLCDGRDFLENVLETPWHTRYRLIDVINSIPKFINEYLKQLNEGYLMISGKYYLGEKYNLHFLESLPVYSKRVKEKEIINGKYIEVNKLLIVSDLYFCLFEIDNKNQNYGTLTFWSNIKALITVKRVVKENICILIWRNKLEYKKVHEIYIKVPNGEEIIHLMVKKMESFGVKYNISQKKVAPREGQIPTCDIDMIEKHIENIEKQLSNNNIKGEGIQYLISLYEKAIEFYSAINNPRYEYFMKKTQECLKMQIMIDYMDKKVNESKNNNINNESSLKSESEIKCDKIINKINIEKSQSDQLNKKQSKDERINQPLSSRDTSKSTLEKIPIIETGNDKPKTSRSLHVAMSNDDDDNPIDLGSDEDDEDEENEEDN